MAKDEREREDLLAEAVALAERVSLRIAGVDDELIVGFRRDGSASVYWGSRQVYQFNSAGALRRAFVEPLLYKAERGRLVSLLRVRTGQAVELVRHALTDAEQAELHDAMRSRLELLADRLADGRFAVLGQVPAETDVVARVRSWLDALPEVVPIARSPRVG